MKKDKESVKFEKKIALIHKLIEQEGSIITWNDRIPDPDNPLQLRQIDITIKRDGKLTSIECRLHKDPQNVKWIEELMGRKVSLKVDAMIAVSSSGFSKGAILKAEAKGIILRDLKDLSVEEIRNWGHKTKILVNYIQYKNIELFFDFDSIFKNRIKQQELLSLISQKNILTQIFIDLREKFKILKLKSTFKRHQHIMTLKKKIYICGAEIKEIVFQCEAKITSIEDEIISVLGYDTPKKNNIERNVKVENTKDNSIEIIKNISKSILTIDLYSLYVPPNSHFLEILFDMKKPILMKSVKLIGRDESLQSIKNIKLSINYEEPLDKFILQKPKLKFPKSKK